LLGQIVVVGSRIIHYRRRQRVSGGPFFEPTLDALLPSFVHGFSIALEGRYDESSIGKAYTQYDGDDDSYS